MEWIVYVAIIVAIGIVIHNKTREPKDAKHDAPPLPDVEESEEFKRWKDDVNPRLPSDEKKKS